MLFTNRYLVARKEALGGRTLMAKARADAKECWEGLADKEVWVQMYQAWRNQPAVALQRQGTSSPIAHEGMWAGGLPATPCTPQELHGFHQEVGWPADEEVHHEKGAYMQPDTTTDFDQYSRYKCHGCLRSPLSVCRSSQRDPHKFSVIEVGLNNFIEHVGKTEAESGSIMILIQGVKACGSIGRFIGILSHMSWSPKAFDIAMCDFQQEQDESSAQLELPFMCALRRRKCIISDRFDVLASECTGALVSHLCEFSTATLFVACHEASINSRCAPGGTSEQRKRHGNLSARIPVLRVFISFLANSTEAALSSSLGGYGRRSDGSQEPFCAGGIGPLSMCHAWVIVASPPPPRPTHTQHNITETTRGKPCALAP